MFSANFGYMSDPLIITLMIERETQAYFTDLRNRYFPKHVNYLSAHITLFHHLPQNMPHLVQTLNSFCKRSDFEIEISRVKNIGNGVAYGIVSEELQGMHADMQKAFDAYLIQQDRQKLWPHITVQNKVTSWKAKTTELLLAGDFKPFSVKATGLATWIYKKGPWEAAGEYYFEEEDSVDIY